MTYPYDSTKDTHEHIKAVRGLLDQMIQILHFRRLHHDESKFQEPEKPLFDKYTPLLKGSTYGSSEYKKLLGEMGPALRHHYDKNSHHPEHFRIPESAEIWKLKELIRDTAERNDEDPALPWLRKYLSALESQVNGMSLLDVIEMLADWKAAGMRHADGNLFESLRINRERFGLSDQLFEIIQNTVKELRW